ncbi:MAG: FAD-binding oxidoreductase [Chloroflexi bacterium]|nr:MAG: FAD-binding oxidoreductase [Chloroflexota bacterium]
MESADVVIVGGGIMGCALAYQLRRRNVDVLLLERETLGSQSTGKCAGGVRQQFSNEGNVRLQRMSVGMLESFEEEIGHPADFRQIGYLFVLTQPQQVEDFGHNMDLWHRVGLSEARWVDPAEAQRMVPVLKVEDVLGCTFCPTDGIASPADVTSGYAAAARRLGARLKEGVAVTGINVASGRVQGVRTSAGDVATRLIFNCAGAWSASFQTSLYFHPEGDGVLIGMSDREEPPGYVEDVSWEFLEKMFAQAARRAPALAAAGVKTAWAGLYEMTPDHQAILGPMGEVEGFWCAAGFSGHGFMQGPAAALLLTQLLLDHTSEIDISSFAFERFARGALVKERNVI